MNSSELPILPASLIGFGLAALVATVVGIAYSILYGGGWQAALEIEGGALGIALGILLFLGLPGLVIGPLVMLGLRSIGARSPRFALSGISAAACIGTYAEYWRRGEPDFVGGLILALYVTLACALTIACQRRQIRA